MKTLPCVSCRSCRDRRLAGPDHCLQRGLELLRVGVRPLVQNDQIDCQPLQAPVLVRAEKLPDDAPILRLVDADQDDREVAGNPVGPQGRGPGRILPQHHRRRPKRRVRVENPARKILEQAGLVHANPEMVELDLRPCPGERDRPLERRGVAILVRQRDGGFARRADERGEDEACALSRHETDSPSEAEDGIEHRTCRVRQRPPVDDRHRRTNPAAPAEEPPAIGLVLSPSAGLAFDDDDVGRPDRRVRRRPGTASGQQGAEIGYPLRLDEETGKGLMRRIRRWRSQHELGIGGQLDLTCLPAEVHDRYPPQLGVVLWRDQHLERGRDGSIPPIQLGAVLREGRAILVRLDAGRLIPRRPDRAALDIPQEEIGSPVIPGDVFPPSGDAKPRAPAVARARGRQHHRIPAVREQVRPRRGVVRRRELTEGRFHELPHMGRRLHLFRTRSRHCHVPGHALLQEKLGRLDDGLAVEPRPHHPIAEHIRERDDGHALMVRHVGANDCHRRPGREPGRRVVERLVESVESPSAHGDEARKVAGGGARVDHGGQSGRVGRDDQVLAEAPLKAQTRNPEVRILVGQVEIAHVVRRFGDAPGNPVLRAVRNLTLDDEAIRLLEQASQVETP